jgi:hypothetical protein
VNSGFLLFWAFLILPSDPPARFFVVSMPQTTPDTSQAKWRITKDLLAFCRPMQ